MSFSNTESQENFLAFHIFSQVEYLLYLLKMTLSPHRFHLHLRSVHTAEVAFLPPYVYCQRICIFCHNK